MKNIYLAVFTLLISISVTFGQSRVYAPELQYPENGAADQLPDVVLNWHAVAGSGMNIQYEVQLADNDSLANPTEFPLSTVTALSASELNFGEVYYWRVRAHDGDEISDWSEVWSFSVLTTVNIKKPTDGGVVNPQVLMEWDQVAGATFYDILVDTLYSWKLEDAGISSSNSVRATFVVDANNYGGVGDDGLVFYYDGQWNIGESGTTKDLLGVYFVNADDGWAVGKSGTVVHYDGTAWSTEDIGASKDLNAVSFSDANNGWAVGKGGFVYYYDGSAWSIQDTIVVDTTNGTTKDLNAVWAVSPTDVWAGGKSGYIAHFDGVSWSAEKPGTKDYMAFWFNAPDDGWASQKSGRISHYDGTSWTEEISGVSKTFYGIAFNGTSGFIVGQSGTLLEYNGSSWSKVTSGTNQDLYGIWFADGAGLYGGKKGAVYSYTGGGFNSPYATTYHVGGDVDSLYLQNLFFGSTYYYKMKMGHSKDTSLWSAARSFKVQSTPELNSPSNGASEIALKAVLGWKEFEGILRYNVQISDNENFEGAFTYFSDSNSILISGLSFGKEYFWRVNAQHTAGVSPWTETWSFTTTNTVNLISPENEATDINACPLLEWEGIPGASKYEIWMDKDENFPNPMSKVETLTSSQCQSQLEKSTNYYWRVRGIVALDTSGWSPTWKFTTEGPQAIDENIVSSSVKLFPNPSNGHFTVQMNSLTNEDVQVQITDISGKVVYDRTFPCNIGSNRVTVDHKMPVGIYQVSLIRGAFVISRRLFIE